MVNFLRYYFTFFRPAAVLARRNADVLFEQIAEIMRILIADVKRNIAHAAVAAGQQMLGRLDTHDGQILDKGLSGLLREHGGEMIRAEADFLRTPMQ